MLKLNKPLFLPALQSPKTERKEKEMNTNVEKAKIYGVDLDSLHNLGHSPSKLVKKQHLRVRKDRPKLLD